MTNNNTMHQQAAPTIRRLLLIAAVLLIFVSSSSSFFFVEAKVRPHPHPPFNGNNNNNNNNMRPPNSKPPLPPSPNKISCKSYSWKEGSAHGPYLQDIRCNHTHRYCCGECSHTYCCDDKSKELEVHTCDTVTDSSKFLNTMVWVVCGLVIFTMCMLLLLIAKLKINKNVRNIQRVPSFAPQVNRYRRAAQNQPTSISLNVFQSDDLPPSYDALNFKAGKESTKEGKEGDNSNELASYDQLQLA